MDIDSINKNTNIASYLVREATERPHELAVVAPYKTDEMGRTAYIHLTSGQLNDESDHIANGLESIGITKNVKTALLVKPSPAFFALVFALFKVGAVIVMIDSGMGLKSMGKCLKEAEPEAFIGIPIAHVARIFCGWGKKTIKHIVTVGKRWFWGGHTLSDLRKIGCQTEDYDMAVPNDDDMAAILFTSGSTGVPKGAVYTHSIFNNQVEYLKTVYNIQPGEMDLSTFPLFALFGPALGMTSVIPDMNPMKPATADPKKLVSAIEDFGTTNIFANPTIVNILGRYAESENIMFPSVKRIISAGAPARPDALERLQNALLDGVEIFTPYGATEALPLCNIGSIEILKNARYKTEHGLGTCIGFPNKGINLKVIKITDEKIEKWTDDLELPDGEMGEIVVSADIVTKEYYNLPEQTALAKIYDGKTVIHRMGDIGYKDKEGKFWFCGRKSHRVKTKDGDMFTVCCEGVFNVHPEVFRTALVGVQDGEYQKPVLCVEKEKNSKIKDNVLIDELREIAKKFDHTKNIEKFLIHPKFPVDVRHNAKIFREKLAVWAIGK